jgi:glycosyltransferase involved in cell wall biosynthesis
LTGLYRRTMGAYTLDKMNKIIVHTETYAATSRVLWSHHPTVIPTGVDLERFRPDVNGSAVKKEICPEGQNLVMFVGRLTFHKGIEYFIDASRYVEDTKFLVVGEGPYRKRLEVHRLNSPRGFNVVFTGNVPDEELPKYYAACDVFVLPSVSRLEGFGLVMVEAMATGKPVVASNMPGMREVMTDGEEGLLAEPLNSEDFAEKINTLLADKALRRRFGENARRTAETRFSWTTIGTQVENLYKEMVGETEKKVMIESNAETKGKDG